MRVLILGIAWIGMFAGQHTVEADQPQETREQAVVGELAEVKQALQALSLKVDALQRELNRPAANHHQADAQRIYAITYRVGDLVPEVRGDFAVAWDPKHLVRYITKHIAPQQWKEAGGAGTVRVYNENRSLVIAQTAEVHQELNLWLKQLRETKVVLDEVAGFPKPEPVKQTVFDPAT